MSSVGSINGDKTPLPPPLPSAEQDAAQFDEEPWIEAPIRVDYGTNVRLGANVFVNFNCTIIDTCLVTIGSRTLIGPNVSFFSGTHPLDPELRNGTKGPELGRQIHVEEDCWIGGNVVVLPGVRIGRGVTIGAGSVVTKVCLRPISCYDRAFLNSRLIGPDDRTYPRSMWLLEIRHGFFARSELGWIPHNVALRTERLWSRWPVRRSRCVRWLSVLMDRRTVQAFDSSELLSMIPRLQILCFSTSES